MPLTRTTSNSWGRLIAKCSHSAELTSMPAATSSAFTSCLTSGTQEPQLVPALVHFFTQPRSAQPLPTAARMVPADDVVAGADRRGVGHGTGGGRLDAAGDQPGGRVATEGAPDQRAQALVGPGVADQHAAEQGGRVVAEHQLGVAPGDRVGVDDLEGVLGGGERVAEAGHVDAEQLELGGKVRAGEGRLPRRGCGRPPPRPSCSPDRRVPRRARRCTPPRRSRRCPGRWCGSPGRP